MYVYRIYQNPTFDRSFNFYVKPIVFSLVFTTLGSAVVSQNVDNAILWINHYPVDTNVRIRETNLLYPPFYTLLNGLYSCSNNTVLLLSVAS